MSNSSFKSLGTMRPHSTGQTPKRGSTVLSVGSNPQFPEVSTQLRYLPMKANLAEISAAARKPAARRTGLRRRPTGLGRRPSHISGASSDPSCWRCQQSPQTPLPHLNGVLTCSVLPSDALSDAPLNALRGGDRGPLRRPRFQDRSIPKLTITRSAKPASLAELFRPIVARV